MSTSNTTETSNSINTIIAVNEFFDKTTNEYVVIDKEGKRHVVNSFSKTTQLQQDEDEDSDDDYLGCSFTTPEEYEQLLHSSYVINFDETDTVETETKTENVLAVKKRKPIPKKK